MNTSMLLGMFDGIKNWFLSILDNIPRIIYFFFAAFASGIDALQCLMRKLAGLDSYWVSGYESAGPAEGGQIVDGIVVGGSGSSGSNSLTRIFGRDPLSEFIYGILGIGERASVYKALHTVFISLSIFALILLVLATMIAMIKSHYNEDYQTTNPWKYIYAAIKGILTYFIIPVMVVIGLNLSSFILNILDQITAGTGEEKVKAMYGSNVVNNEFQAETLNDKDCFTYYDFFGAWSPTTSSTMGGMLFKAAAYSANRVRTGNITIANAIATPYFGDSSCADFVKITNDEERKNYLAEQVDFAFMNCIKLKSPKSISTVHSWYPNVRYIKGTDFTGAINTMSSFSKYNLTAVWLHYDLWQFQFIVAFGGGVTMVGVMLSVILGLMSRLIKGAALFIIYPPLISLGPLDNFKAFKSWGTQFMQQVLMAYGAILGMNIVMLILPYVQTIQWFGPGLFFGMVNSIVNMIILIVGILMMKDFIAVVSGFVGGADANSIGNGLKSEVSSTVKKGFSTMSAMAGGTARVAAGAVRLTGGAVKGIGKAVHAHNDKKALDKAGDVKKAHVLDNKMESFVNASKMGKEEVAKAGFSKQEQEVIKKGAEARAKAKAAGMTDEQADQAAKDTMTRSMKARKSSVKGLSMYQDLEKQQKDALDAMGNIDESRYTSGKHKGEYKNKTLRRAENVQTKIDSGELKYTKQTSGKNEGKYVKSAGAAVGGAALNGLATLGKGIVKGLDVTFDGKKAGLSMADAFVKSMKEMGGAMGLDKVLGGIKDTLGPALSMKGSSFDKKVEGDALRNKHHEADLQNSQREQALQSEANTLLKQLVSDNKEIKRALTSGTGGTTYKKP